jgi:hypothetical protein
VVTPGLAAAPLGYQLRACFRFPIEFLSLSDEDQGMDTIPPELKADMEYAVQLVMSGKKDAEFEKRIHAAADRIRAEIIKSHGLLDIGVPAIRELRDDE